MRFNYFTILDIIPALIWLVILIVIANNYRSKHQDQEHYKYFMPNLYAKFFFVMVFSLFYVLVVKGGDTVAYFETARIMNKLLFHDPGNWFMQMNTDPDMGLYGQIFGRGVGYPPGWIYREPQAFFVAKIISIIGWLTFNSYWATTLIISYITARASWRLYELALEYKLNNPKWLAYGVLFLPSVNFWCTGISKDAIVFVSVLYLVHHLFTILSENRKAQLKNYLWALFFIYLIAQTRAFILAAVFLPFGLAYLSRWLKNRNTNEGSIMAIYVFFILIGIAGFGATLAGQSEAEALEGSEFLQEAQVVQQDFQQNQTYGDKRYSLGEVDFSPSGLLRVSPLALAAGIYRPYIWEALTPSFIFNGLESMLFIFLSILFILNKPWLKLKKINANELLIFSLTFALLLAFMAGFSSILFGVLVRIRAPLLPFLMIVLTIDWKMLLPSAFKEKTEEDVELVEVPSEFKPQS